MDGIAATPPKGSSTQQITQIETVFLLQRLQRKVFYLNTTHNLQEHTFIKR